MSKKKNVGELLLTTTENLADELLFKTANTFLEDAIKSIPFASLITSSVQNYAKFRTLKEQKQLLAFIQEAKNTDNEFIEKFFNNKSNTELGFEILGILDQTYLEHQARMISRVAILLKNGDITKQEFDKYTYIITRLNSHIITKIHKLYEFSSPQFNRGDEIITVPNQPIEFLSFDFIQNQLHPTLGDEEFITSFRNYPYSVLRFFFIFYDKVFKD